MLQQTLITAVPMTPLAPEAEPRGIGRTATDHVCRVVGLETERLIDVLLLAPALYRIRQAGHGGDVPETLPGE